MSTELFDTLRHTTDTLEDLEKPWALIGALALSVYVEPRFTADIAIAVAVAGDEEAEQLLHAPYIPSSSIRLIKLRRRP